MLKHYVVPQLEEFQPRVVFQQDGAPPHWGLIVRDFSNETLSGYAKTLRCSSIRRVPAEGCVSARRCPSTLGFDSS